MAYFSRRRCGSRVLHQLVELQAIAAFLFFASAGVTAEAQGISFEKVEIITQSLTPQIYLLTGSPGVDPVHPEAAGGRVGLLVGKDGVFMVDAQYALVAPKVLAAIRKITPQPIRFLVNTHVHLDHTGGNAAFVKTGAVLIAREETREEMFLPLPAISGAAAPPSDPDRLPTVTYGPGAPVTIRINGETVDLLPVPAAHTAGDTMVRFRNANVIMTGDFFRTQGYPFFDTTRAGSLQGTLDALQQLITLATPDTKIVPGHGALANRADVIGCRDMVLSIRAQVQQMIAAGKGEEDILAAKLTSRYDAHVAGAHDPVNLGGISSADRFIHEVYDELHTKT